MIYLVKPLIKNNDSLDAKGAWRKFVKADFKTKHSREDAARSIISIGYLPSSSVKNYLIHTTDQLHCARKDLRRLYLMPEFWGMPLTDMEKDPDELDIIHDIYGFFGRRCSLKILGQHRLSTRTSSLERW
jgi:hypothetical protein